MLGFQIGQISVDDVLQRIDLLKDQSVLPMDEGGLVIEDDSAARDSAREMRLLLQRLLDLDCDLFLQKMRELFFHLFSVDHEHYRDLLFHAAQRRPEATRDFCLEFFFSDQVLFIDDQQNLHDLMDVLESLGLGSLPYKALEDFRKLWLNPFFRLPSLVARTIEFLLPVLDEKDLPNVRRLFEMDFIPAEELLWQTVSETYLHQGIVTGPIVVNPQSDRHRVTLHDLEQMRWGLGIEGTPFSIAFRYLGCLVARGPEALSLFFEVSKTQPETAFNESNFETNGHRLFFVRGMDLLREEILRTFHHSAEWFTELPEERLFPWIPRPAVDPWPLALRALGYHWGEFGDASESSEFATIAKKEIDSLDKLADQISELLRKHPLPSAEELQLGEVLMKDFVRGWEKLISQIRPFLNVLP